MRNILNSAVQKKFFLMFFTSLIYIIGLFTYFTSNTHLESIFISFLLLILGIFAVLRNYLSPKLVLFWYFMFFFGFFNASLRIKNYDVLYQIAPQDAVIKGQIISIPNETQNKIKFFDQISEISYNGQNEKIKAKTLVNVYPSKNKHSKFDIGDTYIIKGKLRTPFEVSNPSQFDYGKYLKNFDTFTVFYANGSDCKHLNTKLNFKWRFLQGLNNTRNEIIQAHAKCLKSPNLEILGGIVFGDDAVAPPDYIKTSFQHSGLLHILAASGMNVALIYGIWFFILRRLRVPFNLTVSSGIFVVIFYAMMTGLGPSVIRATFMLIFILVGKLIDRDAHSISLLSFVALLMLIYNPAYINDVGFQLSFLVTFGLLVMAPVVFETLAQNPSPPAPLPQGARGKNKSLRFNGLPAWLSGAVFIPLIAQIWVAPIQMYYFNSFSLYSVFANIASLPFVTVISFGGFISSVLALIKPLSDQVCFLFDFVLNPVLNILVTVSNYFSDLPHALIQMPQPSLFQILLYYLLVLLITLLLKIGKNKNVIIGIIALFLILVVSCIPISNKNFETIAFDMQNADAFLIKTPQNKYFIIDSGKMGYRDGKTQAKMIILEYLKDKGIKNIEGLIITHFDSDHAGGAVDLMENLNIKNVYVNSLNDKSHLAQKIYACAKNKTKLKLAKNNEIIYSESSQDSSHVMLNLFQHRKVVRSCDPETSSGRRNLCTIEVSKGVTIRSFVANLKDKGLGDELENENSIITLVSDKNFDELFMGDAGILAFEKIKKYLPQKVEVLKVGHHGAKNVVNKAFLDRINPDVAIISTGLNNYDHPNGVTLDILQSHLVSERKTVTGKRNVGCIYAPKIKILRTDRQHAIKINEKSGKYNIYTYDKKLGFVTNN